MSILLIIVALIASLSGAAHLTLATQGVGFIGGACFLAILARIAQAYSQHQELIQKIDSKSKNIEVLNK